MTVLLITPAKAGGDRTAPWMPAFAGMTAWWSLHSIGRARARASRLPEDAAEDRVDVLRVVALVEERLELGRRQVPTHLVVLFQEVEEAALAVPHRHGVALHGAVGVLAA